MPVVAHISPFPGLSAASIFDKVRFNPNGADSKVMAAAYRAAGELAEQGSVSQDKFVSTMMAEMQKFRKI